MILKLAVLLLLASTAFADDEVVDGFTIKQISPSFKMTEIKDNTTGKHDDLYGYYFSDGKGGTFCVVTHTRPGAGQIKDVDRCDTIHWEKEGSNCRVISPGLLPEACYRMAYLEGKDDALASEKPAPIVQEQPKVQETRVTETPKLIADNYLNDAEYDDLWHEFYDWQVKQFYANMYRDGTAKHYDGWAHDDMGKHRYGPHWNGRSPNSRAEWYDYFWSKLPWDKIKEESLNRMRGEESQREWDREHPWQGNDN